MDYCVITKNFSVICEVHMGYVHMVSHNFTTIYNLYKNHKANPHLFEYDSRHVFHFSCI